MAGFRTALTLALGISAAALLAGAKPTHENAFKLPLVERTLGAVLSEARS